MMLHPVYIIFQLLTLSVLAGSETNPRGDADTNRRLEGYQVGPPPAEYGFSLCYDVHLKEVQLSAVVPEGQYFAVGFGAAMAKADMVFFSGQDDTESNKIGKVLPLLSHAEAKPDPSTT